MNESFASVGWAVAFAGVVESSLASSLAGVKKGVDCTDPASSDSWGFLRSGVVASGEMLSDL